MIGGFVIGVTTMPTIARRIRDFQFDPEFLFALPDSPTSDFGKTAHDYTMTDPRFPFGFAPSVILLGIKRKLNITAFSEQDLIDEVHNFNTQVIKKGLTTNQWEEFYDSYTALNRISDMFREIHTVFSHPDVGTPAFRKAVGVHGIRNKLKITPRNLSLVPSVHVNNLSPIASSPSGFFKIYSRRGIISQLRSFLFECILPSRDSTTMSQPPPPDSNKPASPKTQSSHASSPHSKPHPQRPPGKNLTPADPSSRRKMSLSLGLESSPSTPPPPPANPKDKLPKEATVPPGEAPNSDSPKSKEEARQSSPAVNEDVDEKASEVDGT